MSYRQLSLLSRGRIIGVIKAGKSCNEMAKYMKRSRSVIQKWWKQWKETGNVDRLPGSGRPREISSSSETHLKFLVMRNRFHSCRNLW